MILPRQFSRPKHTISISQTRHASYPQRLILGGARSNRKDGKNQRKGDGLEHVGYSLALEDRGSKKL
jgi:hypothetical protein